ncbi:hypothetical protein IVB46_44225 [Bradyrhizobium sp. 61]|uniref:hypothetical protein n=1 Tax=Bradyrhizobium sp. 61 TaxID=2782679 RepID=UPI001FF85435|nr:hypothetical protein [Bradyrhizobium sp. 61]MCK1282245.1 hypothetical protein [Bradyrhizobium sp. 61]
MTQEPAAPASQDPVHLKLDLLTHFMMESRADQIRARKTILRAQWITCGVGVLAALVTAVVVVLWKLP